MNVGKSKHFRRWLKMKLVVLIKQSYMSGHNLHLMGIFIEIAFWLFSGLETTRLFC